MKVWGALGEVRGALRATVGAASGLQQRSTQRSAARTRCAKSALSVPAKKKPPPPQNPNNNKKNPTWNYKEAMIGRRFPNLSCVKEFGSGNESNKPTRKNR